jgi:HSP20 family molecular chaperone IbpA
MSTISLRLRQIRREKNFSQEELAKQLGISRQAIIALEQGASLPSLPVILALLRVLDITFSDLLDGSWSPFRTFDPQTEIASESQLALYRHAEGSHQIPITLQEDEKTFYVMAELAGVKEEDLTVDMSTQHIMLVAIKKSRLGDKTAHVQEIQFGPLLRILSLPSPIDTNRAQAEFSRGTLYLTLPKLIPEVKRRITFTKEPYGSE